MKRNHLWALFSACVLIFSASYFALYSSPDQTESSVAGNGTEDERNTPSGAWDVHEMAVASEYAVGMSRESVDAEPIIRAHFRPDSATVTATLVDGQILISGLRFIDLPIEEWSLDELRLVRSELSSLQVDVGRTFLQDFPSGGRFVTDAEYNAESMWFSQEAMIQSRRIVANEEGESVAELGHMVIPRAYCEDVYTLREASLRIYRTPVFADYIGTQGDEYVASIMESNPDCVFEVTPDLTTWVGRNPDGAIVGWMSFPVN